MVAYILLKTSETHTFPSELESVFMCPLTCMKASIFVYICTFDCKEYMAMIEGNTQAEIFLYSLITTAYIGSFMDY